MRFSTARLRLHPINRWVRKAAAYPAAGAPVRRLPSPQTDIPAPCWFSRAFAGKARSDIARRILDRTVACLLQTGDT